MISRLAFVIPRLVSECLVDGARDSLMSRAGIEALYASSVLFVSGTLAWKISLMSVVLQSLGR